MEKRDVIIIGGGPAAYSAAVTLRARGKKVLIVSNPPEESPLAKAECVDNYPGMPNLSGKAMLAQMRAHALSMGTEYIEGRAVSAMAMEKEFFVSIGAQVEHAGCLILATGITHKSSIPGESAFLGRGVSYCATCDGMLYRNKPIAVLGFAPDSSREADFLRDIGCQVEFFDHKRAKRYSVEGSERVEALVADDVRYPVNGVFILRSTVSVAALLPGLESAEGSISVRADMSTSIPGVFAAGDCTGKPYQIAKAVGEGNIAALSAAAWLDECI